ncbi:AIPR family protein [Qipengyuania flava]|uniref:AIPR family protein n=1 Tax=Qipengyuania flava TaxID=192812 RepID=UPI003BAF49E0
MHLVTKSYFDTFCRDFAAPFKETKNFEAFCNYCILARYTGDSIELADLVYEGEDPGIDGAFLLLDDRLVLSLAELEEIFATSRREFSVTFVFTQVKSSTSWKKKEIDSFAISITDLLSENPSQPHADFLKEFRLMFKKVFEHIGRVQGGLPSIYAYFMTAAEDTDAVEINGAFSAGQRAIEKLGVSSDTQFSKAPKEAIHELWLAADGPVEARLPTVGYAPFPASSKIDNAYVATVLARDFIDKVLKSQDGSARKKLFEENVRDFLGVDADVNSEIANTLNHEEKRSRFGLMNNGVTIVASSVRPAGQEIFIRDFQIVNGCQTSNVLMALDAEVGTSTSLMVKLIEADEPSVIDDIVRATNRQSKVEDAQFVSTLETLRTLEQYFNARGAKESNRLYFERRRGQYANENVAPVRIFDIREAARCFAATSMMRPDLASRYPNRLTGELLNDVFAPGTPEEDYYSSCFAHYRLKMLISNKKFDGRYSKLRWHIMTAASKFAAENFKAWGFSSKNEALYSLFAENEGRWFDKLESLIKVVLPDPDLSRDVLKSPPLTATVLSLVPTEKSNKP